MKYVVMIGHGYYAAPHLGKMISISNRDYFISPDGETLPVYDPCVDDELIVQKCYDYVVMVLPE